MVEGSLWVYGHTNLSDYYSGALTLRQIVNRLACLPAEAPIWDVLREEDERAEGNKKVADVEATLARFNP